MNAAAAVSYGRSTIVAVLRRQLTLVVLLALPLAFYAVSHDAVGRSVRSLVFGLSWALSTVAFFATIAARQLEPRLALAGWRPAAMVGARVAGLTAFGLALAAVLWVVVALDQPLRSAPAVAVDFAVTSVVAVALGTAVGAVVAAELQGALVLFFVAGLQAVADPFDGYTRLLPFWSSRELGTWAVDGPAVGSLGGGLAHAAVVTVLCAAVTLALSGPGGSAWPRSWWRRSAGRSPAPRT